MDSVKLADLPDELWLEIARWLDECALAVLARTCRRWQQVVDPRRERALTYQFVAGAARAGNLGLLQWLRAEGAPLERYLNLITEPAQAGHAATVEWLLDCGCPGGCAAYNAAAAGRTAVLALLRARGLADYRTVLYAAARCGRTNSIKWAQEHCQIRQTEWAEVFAVAAADGQLRTLQWLRAQGHPWNKWACYHAAKNGHLAALQWLRANGCPIDKQECLSSTPHLPARQWIAHNC